MYKEKIDQLSAFVANLDEDNVFIEEDYIKLQDMVDNLYLHFEYFDSLATKIKKQSLLIDESIKISESLFARLEKINDLAVNFQEEGQFEPQEAFDRVNEIYKISLLED